MVIFHSYVNVYRRVCSIQLGIIIIPTDFHIFQRGRSTTNQQNASVWYFPTFFATFSKRIDTFDQPTWPEVEGHRIRGTMETLPCHLVQRLHWENANSYQIELKYGYGSIPINTIFNGMNIHLPAILGFTRGTRVLTHPQIVTHLQIDIDPKMLDPWAKYSRGGAPQQQRRGGQGWGWRRRQWTGLLDLGLGLSLATGAGSGPGSGEISGDFWSIILWWFMGICVVCVQGIYT